MSVPLPPLYALRAFEAAARLGSFTLAAESLCISQSAVSKHVKNLEQRLGCRLFERRGHHLNLTTAGCMLAQDLGQAFVLMQAACDRLGAPASPVLRLKAPTSISSAWLLDALNVCRQQADMPPVRLSSVWSDDDRIDFATEPYDCAIVLGSGQVTATQVAEKLFDEWLVPVCLPALLAGGRSWQDLPVLHPSPDGRDWRRWLAGSGAAAPAGLAGGQVFDSLMQAMNAAAAGHGVTIADWTLCAPLLAERRLQMPHAAAVQTGDAYYLLWPAHSRHAPRIKQLAAALRTQLPVLAGEGVRRMMPGVPA